MNSKAGLFFHEDTGEPLRLVANGGRLGIAGAGPLVAVTNNRFRNPRPLLPFMSELARETATWDPSARVVE